MAEIEPEKIEVDEKELSLIKDVLKQLTKTIKAFTTYPPNNPIYQKFSADLYEKFNAFFEMQDSLPLKVEQFSMLYKDKEVFYNDERTDNVTLMLFIDGIREICFHKGITLDEIIDFINVLRTVSKGGTLDDDIVTLLWEKDMEHFSYFVPETVEEEEFDIPSEMPFAQAEGSTSTTISGASYSDITVKPAAFDLNVTPPAEEELAALREKLHEIEGDNLLSAANGLFFDMLLTEKDIEGFGEVVKYLGIVIDILLEKNMLSKAIELLGRLRAFLEADIMEEHKSIVKVLIDRLSDEKTIRDILKGGHDPEDIKKYLLFLNKAAITPLLGILAEHEDRKMRRLVCNVLAVIGKHDIQAVAKGLKDIRWYLVRNVLMILGMIKDPSSIRYIAEGLKHPELRVRREAIKALEVMGTPEVKPALINALKDTDSSMRISALKTLRRLGAADVFGIIQEFVLREDFYERPFTEKKEFLETLADLNREAAFPVLSGFFKKIGWFTKARNKELAACAAYGLGIIATEEAVSLLSKEKDSKDGLLREACRKSLKVAGKR